ncbi:PLDc N-terminal domain-containing protein [Spongiibacter sp.]|uniref:PLDc N-terminal domain-containing protein n=1 Tax=Spongiibacter sp. TaxID=2024860 RepID=UPI00356340B1
MEFAITGLFGLLIFIADIWAILNIVQSRNSSSNKLLWIALILLLPLLGLLIWWLSGPRQGRQ